MDSHVVAVATVPPAPQLTRLASSTRFPPYKTIPANAGIEITTKMKTACRNAGEDLEELAMAWAVSAGQSISPKAAAQTTADATLPVL
jgi:hypothetical protein